MSNKRGPKKRADSKVSTSIRVSPDTLARLRASGNVSATVERLVRGATPTITERPTCATCVYWTALPHSPNDAEWWRACCASGPQLQGDDLRGQWLETHRDSSCGSHPLFPAYLASRVDQPQPLAQ